VHLSLALSLAAVTNNMKSIVQVVMPRAGLEPARPEGRGILRALPAASKCSESRPSIEGIRSTWGLPGASASRRGDSIPGLIPRTLRVRLVSSWSGRQRKALRDAVRVVAVCEEVS
jgi:hypothetical protein